MNANCDNYVGEAAAPTQAGTAPITNNYPEPTPLDQLNAERQAALVLKLALEIYLQVPSMAAKDAISEARDAYHEAWIRGRKRVL